MSIIGVKIVQEWLGVGFTPQLIFKFRQHFFERQTVRFVQQCSQLFINLQLKYLLCQLNYYMYFCTFASHVFLLNWSSTSYFSEDKRRKMLVPWWELNHTSPACRAGILTTRPRGRLSFSAYQRVIVPPQKYLLEIEIYKKMSFGKFQRWWKKGGNFQKEKHVSFEKVV